MRMIYSDDKIDYFRLFQHIHWLVTFLAMLKIRKIIAFLSIRMIHDYSPTNLNLEIHQSQLRLMIILKGE